MATAGELDEGIIRARGLVDSAGRIVVLTGAGISTESGIPDFRGPQGVWTRNPAAEAKAHISNYVSDPAVRREIWRQRLAEHSGPRPRPNAGHRAIVTLERREKLHTLITQNVDGLHADAGTSPGRLVEIHGTRRRVRCLSCGQEWPMENAVERLRAGEEDPPCHSCGGLLKSATVSFGQNLVVADLERASAAATGCDLMLAVGSTLQVYPIAQVVPVARANRADLIIVNNEPTPFDDIADVVLRGSIGEVLPHVVRDPGAVPERGRAGESGPGAES